MSLELHQAIFALFCIIDHHHKQLTLVQVGNYRSFAEKCIKPKGLSLEVVMADHQKLRNQNGAGEPESPKVLQRNDTIDDEAPESEDDDTETVSSIMKKVRTHIPSVILLSDVQEVNLRHGMQCPSSEVQYT